MAELLMWGERGLVTTFFQDVAAVTDCERWEAFLRDVGYPLLQQHVTDAWCVIEPDFGNKGFGHPDMAAYLAFDAGDPLVLLLEAKLTTYEKSSWPNTRRQERGFNSKINGQIELNHRLAWALTGFDADAHTKLARARVDSRHPLSPCRAWNTEVRQEARSS